MAESSDASSDPTSGSSGDPFDQASIDALFGGGDEPAPGASDESPQSEGAPPAETPGEINQADIDALIQAGGGEALSDAAETPSAADPPPEPTPDTRVDTMGRPFDEAAAAMQAAIEEEQAAAAAAAPTSGQEVPTPAVSTQPFELPDLSAVSRGNVEAHRVSMLNDVNLAVKIELGRTRMLVEDVLALGEGSVVELDKLAGDPVDVYVNDRLVARGEVLVLNDNFCVRISDVLSNDPHRVTK